MHEHHDHDHDHSHGHDHSHNHSCSHDHTHEHQHSHEHAHGTSTAHDHEHTHEHTHEHNHEAEHSHENGSHESLLKSREEAAAFLQYTLTHNAHHEEELSNLIHSLQHLSLDSAAAELQECTVQLSQVNARLAAVLDALK